eukprot:CAMPEP_0174720550 /NCGR_PEP_ID=MMETSP1094-20130205/33809_1 /TAXON_ID=156173 /ORGANISM="Chrysochromulina brevifilum, Strain UTEX LB 985" /LENGTH=131 /DNA_ID=CAMNT_0015921049 /DNA_START=499 /DNA_END=895 /DNA_ORIENTATION=+
MLEGTQQPSSCRYAAPRPKGLNVPRLPQQRSVEPPSMAITWWIVESSLGGISSSCATTISLSRSCVTFLPSNERDTRKTAAARAATLPPPGVRCDCAARLAAPLVLDGAVRGLVYAPACEMAAARLGECMK